MKLKQKDLSFNVKTIDTDNGIVDGVFSTADVDRQGEVIDQKSWNLNEYMLNPVVLFSHDVQKVIGKTIKLGFNEQGNLSGQIQFAVNESAFAKEIFDLIKGGFLNAFSVGFSSEDVEFNQEGVAILRRNTLYEISVVAVPANALALVKALEGIKEGRVLSAKNREIVQTAADALSKLLNADSDKEADNSAVKQEKKVETPKQTGGKKIPVSVLNRVVRRLNNEHRKAVRTLVREYKNN